MPEEEEIRPGVGGGSVDCAGIINCDSGGVFLGCAGRCERRDLREGEE